MKITIHQPNFIPWYPFFQKIEQADIFVFLTECQFEKGGYQNRFYLDRWHTMSVQNKIEPIKNKKFIDRKKDWNKIKENLKKYRNVLELFDDCITESLVETNVLIINKIINLLDIKTKIFMDYPTQSKSTDRLIEICKKFECDTYISGIGGLEYINKQSFVDAGINLQFQKEEEMNKISVLDIIMDKI
jgi:hypothetical protein